MVAGSSEIMEYDWFVFGWLCRTRTLRMLAFPFHLAATWIKWFLVELNETIMGEKLRVKQISTVKINFGHLEVLFIVLLST